MDYSSMKHSIIPRVTALCASSRETSVSIAYLHVVHNYNKNDTHRHVGTLHVLYTWKFCQFHHLLSLMKFLSWNFLSRVMVAVSIWRPFPHWKKYFPPKVSELQSQLGLAKFLSSENVHIYSLCMYIQWVCTCTCNKLDLSIHRQAQIIMYVGACTYMYLYVHVHVLVYTYMCTMS
jgi:hypothetical protein